MSRDSYTCIEQLDLAARQLEDNSPTYGRFALILIDNVVELIIHKVCADEISYDDMWLKLGKPRFTPEERSDATGQRFDRKVKFCKKAKKITAGQAEAIQICHKYRNELYHTGLKYDDIVWDLAWNYHEIATELLAEVYPDHSWYSGAEVTAAVKKHAGENGQKVLSEMHNVAESIRQVRPNKNRTLPEALSSSAQHRVEETKDSLEFLITDDPQSRTEDVSIYELQFYDYIQSDEPLIKEIWGKVKTLKQQKAAMEFVREIWEPKYKTNPLQNFNKQAKRISRQKSDLNALKAFEHFKLEFAYFAGIVDEAAIALDMHIQQQIDAMRGK